jgi:molybdate transport system ATP-binding protein
MKADHVKQTALSARFVLTKRADGASFRLEVDLTLKEGVLTIFGPSGAGKSLTLAVLAGLERPQSGLIRVGRDVFFDSKAGVWVPPHRRGVGYVPQRSSLFPFTDVLGNVTFGLPWSERRANEREHLALLAELGLSERAHARPEDLSGGERQRVALARALTRRPRLLLLDEPFASIDRAGRVSLGKTLRDFLGRWTVPAVFVTHDTTEAREMATCILPIKSGTSAPIVTPDEFFKP